MEQPRQRAQVTLPRLSLHLSSDAHVNSSERFATLSSLSSSNAGPPRPPIAPNDDDDDDDAPPREAESWFAGGERRYAYTLLSFCLSIPTSPSAVSLSRTRTRADPCPAGEWSKIFYGVLPSASLLFQR